VINGFSVELVALEQQQAIEERLKRAEALSLWSKKEDLQGTGLRAWLVSFWQRPRTSGSPRQQPAPTP
jgi:hypothetical protein